MYDIIIVGAGPAGITAGIYAKRAGANVLILYSGQSNLEKTPEIENYYGFVDGIDGKVLYHNGIEQAKKLGIEVKNKEVLNIEKEEKIFKVKTEDKIHDAKAVIIATGSKKIRPNIKGISEFEGKGISYCAICDGFFYRNKNVVVIGNGKFAINEANDLKNIANNVKILTNGVDLEEGIHPEYEIITTKIKEISGEQKVEYIELEDGSKLDVDGIFIAIGQAGFSDFAKKLGILTDKNSIKVDENMKTNVDGLYCCGDATGGLLQICKSTYEGAQAGLAAAKYIKTK
ncbi:MAG: NAD(P)/FAD-dependent oxidoreductase [Clostridia bacterium]|nr:NAD(P)/FAD-dependent oxidoreductase [Clostridia bacterium]